MRGAGNDLADLFEGFLDDPKGDALVVVEAGDLAKTAALVRKLFDGPQDRRRAPVLSGLSAATWPMWCAMRCAMKDLPSPPTRWRMRVSRLPSDRGVTRREIEKLLLYVQGQEAGEFARRARGDGR